MSQISRFLLSGLLSNCLVNHLKSLLLFEGGKNRLRMRHSNVKFRSLLSERALDCLLKRADVNNLSTDEQVEISADDSNVPLKYFAFAPVRLV